MVVRQTVVAALTMKPAISMSTEGCTQQSLRWLIPRSAVTMAVNWLTVRTALTKLQEGKPLGVSILRDVYPGVDTLLRNASTVPFTCSPSLATELAERVYAAAISILKQVGTPTCKFSDLDAVALQCVVRSIGSSVLVFSGMLQGNVGDFGARLSQLKRSGMLEAWAAAADRLASALQQQQLSQDSGIIQALDTAGAVLTFWVPSISMCKDCRALSSCEQTVLPAAKLAAAVMQLWSSTSSSSGPPIHTVQYAEVVRVKSTQAAIDTGNSLASILDPYAVPASLANNPAGLLSSDAVLHILLAHLAYSTFVLHQRCNGAAAVKFAAASSSSSSKGKQYKAAAVPAHHKALLAAMGLEGYSDIDEDQSADARSIEGSCKALTRVLWHRHSQPQQQQQGAAAVLQSNVYSPLLQTCIEQLLLLGPAADLYSIQSILELMHHTLWLSLASQMQGGAAVSTAAAMGPLDKQLQLALLLQVGPVVLAAVTEGSAAGGSEQTEPLKINMMGSYARMVLAVVASGGCRRPLAAAFEVAPLTISTVLEAVVRSQGLLSQQSAVAAAMIAADPMLHDMSSKSPIAAVLKDMQHGDLSQPLLLYMVQQIVDSMREDTAVQHGTSSAAAPAVSYPPTDCPVAAEGIAVVQLPGGSPNSHAECCLLISCMKLAAAVCKAEQYTLAGINVAAGAAAALDAMRRCINMPWDNMLSHSSSSNSSSSSKLETTIKLLAAVAVRCLDLLAALVNTGLSVGEGTHPTPQQQQQQQQQCPQAAVAYQSTGRDVMVSIDVCLGWLQVVLYGHKDLLGLPEEAYHDVLFKVSRAFGATDEPEQPCRPAAAAAAVAEQNLVEVLQQINLKTTPADAVWRWQEVAKAVHNQVPVRLCCNHLGCTQLKGLGELESVSAKGTRCSAYKVAHYCTPACQKAAWPGHKPVCARYKEARSS